MLREQDFRAEYPDEYDALVQRAKQLGAKLRITPTNQYPASVVV